MNRSAVFALACIIVLMLSFIAEIKPVKASGDSWVERALIPFAMDVSGVTTVNNEVYAFGQYWTYAYNPNSDGWTAKTPMPTSRSHFTIVAYQN